MFKKLNNAASMMLTTVFLFSVCVISAAAQNASTYEDRTPQSRKNQYKMNFSTPQLESFRADLINFVRAYRDAAALINPHQAQKFDGIEEKLMVLSEKQLDIIRSGMPDVTKVSGATTKLRNAVAKSIEKAGVTGESTGFPNADYPSCGSTRIDDEVVDASDTALFVAEGVRDAASRACDEVIVVLGEGGNGSLACIITDGIYLAAKVINYGLHYCNDKIDSAEQQALYQRLTHMHTDLESSVANDNQNRAMIINNDNANTTTITTAVSSAKTEIITNDNSNKTAIINNDNSNTQLIRTDIENSKTAIIVNANANKDELLRLQIHADLAAVDSATPVAVFMLPASQGGYLELVRTIVADMVSKLAGSSISQANASLAKGDAYKNSGDYKNAYFWYRKAYQSAAR